MDTQAIEKFSESEVITVCFFDEVTDEDLEDEDMPLNGMVSRKKLEIVARPEPEQEPDYYAPTRNERRIVRAGDICFFLFVAAAVGLGLIYGLQCLGWLPRWPR